MQNVRPREHFVRISNERSNCLPYIAATVLTMNSATAGLFFYGLAALAAASLLYILHRQRCVSAWPAVSGQIVQSEVSADGDGDSYPSVTYRYSFGGKHYRSSSILPHGALATSGSYSASVAAKYPAGSSVKVYVNPSRPSDSALEPNVPPLVLFLHVAVIVMFPLLGAMFRA